MTRGLRGFTITDLLRKEPSIAILDATFQRIDHLICIQHGPNWLIVVRNDLLNRGEYSAVQIIKMRSEGPSDVTYSRGCALAGRELVPREVSLGPTGHLYSRRVNRKAV